MFFNDGWVNGFLPACWSLDIEWGELLTKPLASWESPRLVAWFHAIREQFYKYRSSESSHMVMGQNHGTLVNSKITDKWACIPQNMVHVCVYTVYIYIIYICITLHYITLRCITLHYITFHYITLHNITYIAFIHPHMYHDDRPGLIVWVFFKRGVHFCPVVTADLVDASLLQEQNLFDL